MIDPKTSLAYDVLELQGIARNQAGIIIQNAKKLFNLIPNIYNDKESNVGLLVGKVQSGKTSVMIASAAMAFENGHNVVIAFLSDTELLLTQNYERMKNTFAKAAGSNIKVYQVSKDGDFNSLNKEELAYLHRNNKKILICVLKHKVRIKSVTDSLEGTGYLDDCVLVFDDEGDDVSQNTASNKTKYGYDENGNFVEKNYSATNKAIKIFKSKFARVSYVSVTATPESIVLLQSIQHLAPDYVLTTPPGPGYCGLSYFHSEHRDELIYVTDDKADDINQENGITVELKDAIAHFLAGCYIRNIREVDKDFKHSMMIHSSRLIVDHDIVTNKVIKFIKMLKDHSDNKRNFAKKYLEVVNQHIKDIDDDIPECGFEGLSEVLSCLKITCMNGMADSKNIALIQEVLPYHIFIGGDLLDRGVTIAGLAVVYIVRQSKIGQMDTLLQRARWFGYKSKYIDTCKVYMTSKLDEQFRAMVPVDNAIWDMLCECSDNYIAPREYDFEFELDSKLLRPTSTSKASYENVLVGLRSAQKFVMLNKNYEESNQNLVNTWIGCHRSEIADKKYGHLTHKSIITTIGEISQLLEQFRLPQEDSNFSLSRFKSLIKYLKYGSEDKVEVLLMCRPDGSESRSTINETNEITGLLQGHSTNKTKDDPDYYPGDRYIVGDKPMLQIHNVVLKNDIKTAHDGSVKLSKGSSTIMLAWMFPQSDFKKMVVKRKHLPE